MMNRSSLGRGMTSAAIIPPSRTLRSHDIMISLLPEKYFGSYYYWGF